MPGRDDELGVEPGARLGDGPERARHPVLERPERGEDQRSAVEPVPGERDRRVAAGQPDRADEPEGGGESGPRELERPGLLADLEPARPGVGHPPRLGQPVGPAVGADHGQGRGVQSVQPRPGDPVPEPSPGVVAGEPGGEVGRDARLGVEHQGVADGRERDPQPLGHGPAGGRGLVNDQAGDAGPADDLGPDLQDRPGRPGLHGEGVPEGRPSGEGPEVPDGVPILLGGNTVPPSSTTSNPAAVTGAGGPPRRKKVARCPRARIASASAVSGLRCPGALGPKIP